MLEGVQVQSGHYLALDPGHATGYATFGKQGKLVDFGTLRTPEAFFKFLNDLEANPPSVIICEEFKLFQHKAIQQSGSDMVASRMIGAMEYFAYKHKCKIHWQPASIKKIAEMWSGKKPPSNHKESHAIDAYNHGVYYLTKAMIIKPTRWDQDE